ncbi:N-acyl-D-amino-acid deacylase family protein [Quisquiliibacterium transsilvanicum]|uniref:N-acyl-D-aspartate/D-glutamate deacylase n=1 Tax=Quisquiliibacterium transsilvanicum TaxID=1549638 RepID=A0A7W8HGI9_9BURK|nr:amidohydrolase family protein [Quisquiliibacterium transsilvanicum]MBB5271684.1 N-acyl-D-aspartate/D-glutamate deacylase [Quisquiliibacterium transsilvanicum]
MSHEIVIRGGTVVDGSGREAFRGDVAIDDGRITAVGRVDGPGRREIDAEGMTVTPGFVDIHTHLDAQIGWDPDCTPLCWHGITTALLGNCGVTFAPCRPGDRELLAAMMETVEDIPREAILSGLPWDWEDYGGYLDAIERLKPGINVAGLVGHSALRFYVMGERAVEEQATDEERRRMAELTAQSIDRGAVGFSTNRFAAHKLPDGRAIPGTFADPAELVEIARQVGPRKALMQAVGADFDLLRTLADDGHSRVLFSYGVGPDGALAPQRRAELEELCRGREMTAVAQVRSSGLLFGLQSGLPIANRGPAWKRLRAMGLDERLAAIRDAGLRATLVEEAKQHGFPTILGAGIERVYYMGDGPTPDYAAGDERQLSAMAAAAGEHWSETFLRLSIETGGRALFTLRMFNPDMEALGHLISSDDCLPGLGDAGAHVTQVMDAGWATFILSHWVRERGLYSLEEGVRRITSAPARVIGLKDRGVLAPGMRADVNVFDATRIGERQPEIVHDFPGGAPRYVQRSVGYRATLVNGRVNLLDGELTGERAGQVLRHGH